MTAAKPPGGLQKLPGGGLQRPAAKKPAAIPVEQDIMTGHSEWIDQNRGGLQAAPKRAEEKGVTSPPTGRSMLLRAAQLKKRQESKGDTSPTEDEIRQRELDRLLAD